MPIITGGSGSGGGAVSQLALNTLAAPAATFDLTSIPATATHLQLWILARGTTAAASFQVLLTLNNDGGANYDRQQLSGGGVTVSAGAVAAGTSAFVGTFPANTASASAFGSCELVLPFYTGTTAFKTWSARCTDFLTLGTTTSYESALTAGLWRSAAAVTRITLTPSAGNFATGSAVALYGVL